MFQLYRPAGRLLYGVRAFDFKALPNLALKFEALQALKKPRNKLSGRPGPFRTLGWMALRSYLT